MNELKEKFKTFKALYEKGHDSLYLLNEFLDLLNQVNADPLGTVYANPELKKFFFEEFVGGLTKRIAGVKTIGDEV